MTLKEVMEMNPVLITGVATSFIGVCTALGAKDLLAKFYDRYCKKEDEKDEDHLKVAELEEKFDRLEKKLDKVIASLEVMQENDIKGFKNDLKILENELVNMQNRALAKEKVSNSCMPMYMDSYTTYCKLAEETEGYEPSQTVLVNHQRILKLVEDGKVVDNLKEWYK